MYITNLPFHLFSVNALTTFPSYWTSSLDSARDIPLQQLMKEG